MALVTKSVTNFVTTAKTGGRVIQSEAGRTAQTWLGLFEGFHALPVYRTDIEADLRPIWRRALREVEDLRVPVLLPDLVERQASPAVKEYLQLTEDFVGSRLRLTVAGKPSQTAHEWLHTHVEGLIPFPGTGWGDTSHLAQLDTRVSISGFEARMEVNGRSGHEVPVRLGGHLFQRIGEAELQAFRAETHRQWDLLLDRVFADYLDSCYEPRGPRQEGEARNLASLELRYSTDLPALAQLLYRGRRPDRSTEMRLRKIAAQLGIDWPRTSRRRSAA